MKLKSITLPAVAYIAATLSTGYIAVASPDPVDQLIAVDKTMQHAFLVKDAAALDAILTNDYMLVSSSGAERTKADVMADLKSSDSHWEINETSGWQVRVHGCVGIVVATLHQKGVDHGQPYNNTVKFSDTYILENGNWRNVHAHASRAVDVRPATP